MKREGHMLLLNGHKVLMDSLILIEKIIPEPDLTG